MFHPQMLAMIKQQVPAINPLIGNGLAVHHFKHIESYVDTIFRTAGEGFQHGIRYVGCRHLSPAEEFNFVTRKRGSRTTFDIAKSDFYLMAYQFEVETGEGQREVIERLIYLPFVRDGGIMYINNARYRISPILSDQVISINHADVFVRLLKAKITVHRLAHTFRSDGENDEIVQLTWSNIYNNKDDKKTANKPKTSLAHYLFCKHGFSGSMKLIAGADAYVVQNREDLVNYPKEEWVVCESSGIPSKGMKNYRKPSALVVVRRSQYGQMAKQLIAGFFYVADRYFFRFDHSPEHLDDHRFWRILLGLIIRRVADMRVDGTTNDGRIITDMNDHIASLDEYLDTLYKKRLEQIGYPCHDIYDLFRVIMSRIDAWLSQSDNQVTNKYDKELAILYDACFALISNVNKMYYKLRNAARKDRGGKRISLSEYEDVLREHMPPTIISGNLSKRAVAKGITYSGDNKLFKVTTEAIPQTSANSRGGRRGDQSVTADPTKKISASMAEVCTFVVLSKADETGDGKISPYLQISDASMVVRSEALRPLIEKTQQILTAR